MSQKTFNTVTGIIFAIMGVLHLLRVIMGWEAIFAGAVMPIWISWVGLVIASYLAYSAFTLNK